jgi:hypothetical protein
LYLYLSVDIDMDMDYPYLLGSPSRKLGKVKRSSPTLI